MDPELKAALDEIRRNMATRGDLERFATKADVDLIRADLERLERGLRREIAALRDRVDEGFKARKEDEDLALVRSTTCRQN